MRRIGGPARLAALVLVGTLALTGCQRNLDRANHQGGSQVSNGQVGSGSQSGSGGGSNVDTSSVDGDLNSVDGMLGDSDKQLSDDGATPADADSERHTMKRLLRARTAIGILVAIGVAAVGVVAAAPAFAADGGDLSKVKAAVTLRIDMRLRALQNFDFTVQHAAHLSSDHKSTLHSLVTSDSSGLTTLRTKVQGETTLDALKADATSMVNDYRVFILVGPKVRLTVVSDAEVAAEARLQQAHDKLAGLVAKAKAAGNDTSQAEQDLAAMQASIDKAKSDADGQVATLLGIQPGPDGTAIRAQVDTVRAALHTARADLKSAVASGKKVRDFLRSLKKATPAPTAS